jgi:hypothetical protein
MPETFGLGAALVVSGRSITNACLIVPDDLAGTEPEALARMTEWATAHPVATTIGPRPWRVVALSEFYDPLATVEEKPWAFQPNAYSGAGFVVGADLGRTFGLSAEHCGPRKGRYRNEWEMWLPGWGVEHGNGAWKRRSPHRPALRVTARRVGWQVEFGPCGRDAKGTRAGKRVGGQMWRGAFVDVLSAAYMLDADRGASFAEHCEDVGLPAFELPLAVRLDEHGAEQVAGAVHAVHALALVLDDHAGRWFTTSRDRREGRGKVDLARTVSPGALASQIPARFRLRAPLETLRLSDQEHRPWAQAFHGGWCEAEPRLLGVPFYAVSADVSSCFPLVAHLLGWWELHCATGVRRHDVTEELRRLCRRAVCDPTVALGPATWHRFGATLVEVIPDGEHFPVAVEDQRRPDGRMEVVPVHSKGRSIFYAWPDVLGASVRSRRMPIIVRATRYEAVGRQDRLRRKLPVLPGLVFDVEEDPALVLVRHRRNAKLRADRAKARGDEGAERANLLFAAELRVVVNALCFGNLCRLDSEWRYNRKTRTWRVEERPGPWTFFPIASSIQAGARLLLAVFDRMVSDLGGIVAYRDTDSSLIPATRDGGTLALSDSSTVRALSWTEVDTITGAFSSLSPEPDWPVWKVKRERE